MLETGPVSTAVAERRSEPIIAWSDDFDFIPELSCTEPWRLTDSELIAEVAVAQHRLAAAQARWLSVLAEVERRGVALAAASMPTSSWLASGTTHSARTARSDVLLATRLGAFPQVRDALARGSLSREQAEVIVQGLDRLPDELDRVKVDEVADHLVKLGRDFNPPALRRLVNRAVEVVAPDVAEDADRQALLRDERAQQRDRYFAWRRDPDGSVGFHGRLPAVEGELLVNHLTAIVGRRRAADALNGVESTRAQALADALAQVVAHHAGCNGATVGGDWAKVLVTIDLDELLQGVGSAGLLASGESISAGAARRLACSAELIPHVLGGESLPRDYGRARRLFSPAQKLAIAQRDRGCVFPGCDRPPGDCDAHHCEPFARGGETNDRNGVLLCLPHHRLVEPDLNGPPDQQWVITFDDVGNPVFSAPVGPTGARRTSQHARFRDGRLGR